MTGGRLLAYDRTPASCSLSIISLLNDQGDRLRLVGAAVLSAILKESDLRPLATQGKQAWGSKLSVGTGGENLISLFSLY